MINIFLLEPVSKFKTRASGNKKGTEETQRDDPSRPLFVSRDRDVLLR